MDIGGIFGPKKSGKTTLARHLSKQYWTQKRFRSLVLDPNQDQWGEQAFVTTDEKLFWNNVWKTRDCLIIVDEAAETIKRNKELIPVFTRLRHLNHVFIVIGHSGVNLLPVMREQIDCIFLFRQAEPAAKLWAITMAEEGLLNAKHLQRHQFIRHELYGKPEILKLKITP